MLLTRRLLARLAALLPLTGCDDGWQPEPPVRLPPGLPEGATEPRRWALAGAAGHFLDRPATLRGQPAEAAWAAALVEYLATAFQDGREVDGRHLTRLLREGRTTLRAALRIPPEARPRPWRRRCSPQPPLAAGTMPPPRWRRSARPWPDRPGERCVGTAAPGLAGGAGCAGGADLPALTRRMTRSSCSKQLCSQQ
ncbi:hypothetical protein ACFQU2_04700 [Siccirubricoccus deserti]